MVLPLRFSQKTVLVDIGFLLRREHATSKSSETVASNIWGGKVKDVSVPEHVLNIRAKAVK
jgi:hypothetical protein